MSCERFGFLSLTFVFALAVGCSSRGGASDDGTGTSGSSDSSGTSGSGGDSGTGSDDGDTATGGGGTGSTSDGETSDTGDSDEECEACVGQECGDEYFACVADPVCLCWLECYELFNEAQCTADCGEANEAWSSTMACYYQVLGPGGTCEDLCS